MFIMYSSGKANVVFNTFIMYHSGKANVISNANAEICTKVYLLITLIDR